MTSCIHLAINRNRSDSKSIEVNSLFREEEIRRAIRCFGKSPLYARTPLHNLRALAGRLGVAGIYVKDESGRFGLNSFKVLGGFYAILNYLAGQLGKELGELDFEDFKKPEYRKVLGDITFTSATDGNHGFGVAWTAQQLGGKAVIFMPKGSSENRVRHIEDTGARVIVTNCNYDDTVRIAQAEADKYGRVIIQDTAWEGYEAIPRDIMKGYAIIAAEAMAQMKEDYGAPPTHVFVQAGVGALAAAVVGYFTAACPEAPPVMIIVEPIEANCIYQSVKEGVLTKVSGELKTIMAGLACGEPNPIAWEILRHHCYAAAAVSDAIAEEGMRLLAKPLEGDPGIVSGESGAVTAGMVLHLLYDQDKSGMKDTLHLDRDSKILVISTEGDTDPDIYAKIIGGESRIRL